MTAATVDTTVLLAPAGAGTGALQRVAEREGVAEELPPRSRATRALLWLWRPTAAGGRFSFSYSREWIGACIGGPGAVGLDLEALGDVTQRVAQRTMTAADERRLLSLAPADRERLATAHWCAAEAVAKVRGTGLPMLLGRRTTTGLRSSGTADGVWFRVLEPLPGLCCAIAGTAAPGRILVYRLSESQAFEPLAGDGEAWAG